MFPFPCLLQGKYNIMLFYIYTLDILYFLFLYVYIKSSIPGRSFFLLWTEGGFIPLWDVKLSCIAGAGCSRSTRSEVGGIFTPHKKKGSQLFCAPLTSRLDTHCTACFFSCSSAWLCRINTMSTWPTRPCPRLDWASEALAVVNL